jgi:two-component system, NtrC family, sensor kinase
LKSFSRKSDEEFVPCDIKHCVAEALLITHNVLKYNVTVKNELTASLPLVRARPQQITQVFINLLNNAADALEAKKQGTICILSRVVSDQVHLCIDDDGPGIDHDKLDHIFDPFVTTKTADKGTGLGLSISKGIMEDHGGALVAENRAEGGARFIMILPVAS